MKIHIVQKGDTLWKIAKKYGVNFEELKKMNTQLSNPDMIMPGMKIKVPGAGGTIKKETPVGSKPGTNIKMGTKKEMPIEHPVKKEKPITKPIVEAPKEVPKKEMPVVEKPQQQLPLKQVEVPKKPFVPKMPKPVMPEIDINNYYMMNMANIAPQQPAQLPPKPIQQPIMKPIEHKPIQKPIMKPIEHKPIQQPIMKPVEHKPIQQPIMKPIEQPLPQLPPKPVNVLPQVKPISEYSPEIFESESYSHTHKGGYTQPMYPYQPNCLYPISPVMPGSGFQGGYPQHMPYPQVQGVASVPMYPSATMPMHQMPHHGMAGVESHGYVESSSMHMPMHQMPHINPAFTQPTQAQMPAPVMGIEESQFPLQPSYTAPAMQQPIYGYPEVPCQPYHLVPISPVMPGSGFCGPTPMPYGYPQMGVMPQVQGVMEEYPQMAQMPLSPTQTQMPLMPMESQQHLMPTHGVKGVEAGCGCDGGMPHYGSPAFGMGGAPMYNVPYGQQMGFPSSPYMNPYGYGPMGGTAFGMPRSSEESSGFDV